jgi:Zn-dependent peptidase ImmA (M78 family)
LSFPSLSAQRVISDLGISCVEDLYLTNEIAWERGALVLEEKLSGAEARLLIAYPRSIITVSTAISDLNRRRFGATHEIGHLEMHRGQCKVFNCSKEDLDSGGTKNRASPSLENEANEFASHLLMPDQFVRPYCKDLNLNLASVIDLSNRFKVSLTAAALRFIQISTEPLAVVVSSDGYIRWFEGNKDFFDLGLFVNVGERLSRESLAIRAFQGISIPPKAGQVPISAWMRQGSYSSKATLSEQSLAMPNYNSVLSFIWINELIDDDDWFE